MYVVWAYGAVFGDEKAVIPASRTVSATKSHNAIRQMRDAAGENRARVRKALSSTVTAPMAKRRLAQVR